jgi:hypothetical protein
VGQGRGVSEVVRSEMRLMVTQITKSAGRAIGQPLSSFLCPGTAEQEKNVVCETGGKDADGRLCVTGTSARHVLRNCAKCRSRKLCPACADAPRVSRSAPAPSPGSHAYRAAMSGTLFFVG